MRISSALIRKKALENALEVEHLLGAAHSPSMSLAQDLDGLASEMDWRLDAQFPTTPWRKWIFVVSEYCRGGYQRLIEIAADRKYVPFVCGLLEELRGDDALRCLHQVAGDLIEHPERDLETAIRVAQSVNLLCLLKPRANPESIDPAKVRDFLIRLLVRSVTDAQRGIVLCALRYYGDENSLAEIAKVPRLPKHWESTRLASRRAILKRLRTERS